MTTTFHQQPVSSAGEARDAAIDWQNWMTDQNLSWGELYTWQSYFEGLLTQFPELADEFHENGIC